MASTARTTERADLLAGARAMAPFVLAYVPFALVIGSTVANLDNPVAGWAGSWLIFGGSAHLAAVRGIADGTAVLAVVTGLLVQTRLLVYGASMAPRWRDQPSWFRAIAPALLIEPTWALAEQHAPSQSADEQRGFFLGAALTLAVAWSATIAVGAVIGNSLPRVGLDLAAPLCLLAIVGPKLRDRPHCCAAVAAAAAALVGQHWPAGTGILFAIVAGSVAAQLARGSAR
jgi:predicted branched-subunit amino acid permease